MRLIIVASLLTCVSFAWGCGSGGHCVPGTTTTCSGSAGCVGYQVCNASGSYGPCTCTDGGALDAGTDGGVLDAGADGGDGGAQDAAMDGGSDASSLYGGGDAASMVDAAVVSCASTPCARGYCDDGVCWSTPETGQPYHFSRCDLFTADPPPEVWNFVRARGMIWGAGGRTVVRHDGARWLLSFDPLALTRVTALLGSASTVVVATNAGTYRRDDDAVGWVLLPAASGSAIRSRALEGSRLYVVDNAGALFVHDGTGWTSMTAPTTTGTPQLVTTTSAAVYVSTSASELARWDGSAWSVHVLSSSLPVPPPITALAAGDESSVFVNGNVRFDGSTFVTTTGGSVLSVASGHVIGASSVASNPLQVGDGHSVVEWTATGWTALTLPPPPPYTPELDNYAVFSLPDGYFYRTALNAIVHDSTGQRELWVDGPFDVVIDSPLDDMRFDGWDGVVRITGDVMGVLPGTQHQYPRRGARAWSDGSIVFAYAGDQAESVAVYDGTSVTTVIPRATMSFSVLRARTATDFDYIWHMTGDHVAVRTSGTSRDVAACSGGSFGNWALASQHAVVETCFGGANSLVVFDGTASTTGTTPAGFGILGTIGTVPDTSAYLGDGAVAYMAYDGTSWTSGSFPSGVFVAHAVGPSLSHPVAVLSDTAGGAGTRIGWIDDTGTWRSTGAHGVVTTFGGSHAVGPVVTDGTSVVWSTSGTGYVTRCRLGP